MPHRPCADPRCPNYARPNSSRCDEHARQYERERSRRRRADPTSSVNVYHRKKWATTRKKKLFMNPTCEECGERLAREVDHVVPLHQGGDPYALDNLASLCSPCHWAKTGQENSERAT